MSEDLIKNLRSTVERLQRECVEQRIVAKRRLELLHLLEWSGSVVHDDELVWFCHVCEGFKPGTLERHASRHTQSAIGHMPDCKLANELLVADELRSEE